jgi:Alginate lyase
MEKQMPIKLAKWGTIATAATLTIVAFAITASNTPGENFPIMETQYDLQSFDSSGNTDEVPVTNSLQDRFFYSNCYNSTHCYTNVPSGAAIFKTPSGFGSTPNSNFPRVELRATKDFFDGDTFTNTQTGTAYIVTAPSTNSIIFAQIHGEKTGGSEMFKLRWQDGEVIAGVKAAFGDEEAKTSLTPAGLKDQIAYTLTAVGTSTQINVTIKVSVNGGAPVSKTFTYLKSNGWSGFGLYFKAGDYNQDASNDGSEAVVAYSALNVTYN